MAPSTVTRFISLVLVLLTPWAAAQAGHNILQFVDSLIGTSNGGHVFPGSTLPYGMAKAVADVNGENQGGYSSQGYPIIGTPMNIPVSPNVQLSDDRKGFSHMHDSGTGGVS